MAPRKPTADEIRVHQLALTRPEVPLVDKDISVIIPDAQARVAAMNFLTGAGLFKVLQDKKGVSWKVLTKHEMDVKKDLTQDENIVFGHISASENKGVWTKQLKVKTDLHQTVLDRCLKGLTSKGLIKTVKSVQHPTRKTYMLAHLEPSIELTGGPWYTDNELDVEFIRLLSNACLFFIKECSFPPKKKLKSNKKDAMYSISSSPKYPSVKDVQDKLAKTKVSTTELKLEDVESLLNVLVLDGEIEKIPAFGTGMWDATILADQSDSDEDGNASDSDDASSKKKKKKKKSSSRTSKRKRDDDSSDASDSSDDSDDERDRRKSKSKSRSGSRSKSKSRSRKKRKEYESSEDESSDDDSDDGSSKKRKKKDKKKRSKRDDSSEEEDSDEEERKRKKKKKRKSRDESDDSGSDSDPSPRKRKTSSSTKVKKEARSPSPVDIMEGFSTGSAYVYRAVHQEKISSLGFLQAPCSVCPVFEFCKDKGPVNPGECTYYTTWLDRSIALETENLLTIAELPSDDYAL